MEDDEKQKISEPSIWDQLDEWRSGNRERLGNAVASITEPINEEVYFFMNIIRESAFREALLPAFIDAYKTRGYDIALDDELVEIDPITFKERLDEGLKSLEEMIGKARAALQEEIEYEPLKIIKDNSALDKIIVEESALDELMYTAKGLIDNASGVEDVSESKRGAVLDDSTGTLEKK